MHLPLLQSALKSTLLRQVTDTPCVFLSANGTAALLQAPAWAPVEACHLALDSLVCSRRIRRYTQLTTAAGHHCYLVLRPEDPGSPADGNS